MKPTLIGIVFFLLGLTSGIVFFNQIDIKESSLVSLIFGDSTGIGTLDPMKATSSPYDAITPRIHGKNIYAPYSSATTSSVYATTFCINNGSPDCITAWSAGGGEANTASNLGTGLNLFDTKSGVDLRFNSISAGSNITLSTTTNANTIVIASTASGGGADPFITNTSWGALMLSTTSRLAFPEGLISSSTMGRLTVGTLTATSTITGTLTGNASSATALAVDGGNCSAGSFPLGVDTLGAVQDCTDAWTEAENTSAGYISDGNTNWDNSYGFTTFTWPFTPSTSWGALAQATSSILQMNGALISSSTIGQLTVSHITATSTATSTFAGGISTLGLSSANGLTITGNSTSTFANGINLTGGCFRVNGSCISAGAGGTPGGSDTQIQFNDGGSFGGTNFVYDSDWLGSGYKAIKSVGASIMGFVGGDGGVDTTGDVVVIGGGNGNGTGNGGALLLGDTEGTGILMSGGATGGGGYVSVQAGLGGVTSGAGGSISLTAGSAQGGDSDGGSITLTTGALSGAGINGFLNISSNGGSSLAKLSTSLLTADRTFSFPDWSGEFAVSTSTLQVSSITSTSTATSTFQGGVRIDGGGLKLGTNTGLLISSTGNVTQYAGTACTNQFVRSLNSSGVATCATIASTDVDSTIAVSARNLTVAGTSNQITSSAGAQNLTADRTWTLSFPSNIIFPNSIFAHSATSTLLQSASSTIGNLTVGTFVATSTEEKIFSVTIASTSPAFIGSGQIPISAYSRYGIELTQYRCWVVGGTNKVAFMTDGTNDTESSTCLTTLTSDTDVATNDTFTAGELKYLEFGATSGTVDYITFEAYGYVRR